MPCNRRRGHCTRTPSGSHAVIVQGRHIKLRGRWKLHRYSVRGRRPLRSCPQANSMVGEGSFHISKAIYRHTRTPRPCFLNHHSCFVFSPRSNQLCHASSQRFSEPSMPWEACTRTAQFSLSFVPSAPQFPSCSTFGARPAQLPGAEHRPTPSVRKLSWCHQSAWTR